MSRLRAFLDLAPEDRGLLLKAFVVIAGVRLALRFVRTDRLRAWASRRGQSDHPVGRIAWAVRTAARYWPGTTCLCSALAMQRLLSASGHACELHIGVAKRQSVFAAHAWVVREGEILVGEHDQDEYTKLVAWRAGTADPV